MQLKKNTYLLYSLLLPLLVLSNLCFAPFGGGDNIKAKAKVEIRNDRQDLLISSNGKLFAYNTIGLLGEVPQWPDAVNTKNFTFTIGTLTSPLSKNLDFEVCFAGASVIKLKTDPFLGLPTIPAAYNYIIHGEVYPGSTLVIKTPAKKDVVLWGNSLMGAKAQSSDIYQLNDGTKFTVIWEVVYEWGERKAKIYVQ